MRATGAGSTGGRRRYQMIKVTDDQKKNDSIWQSLLMIRWSHLMMSASGRQGTGGRRRNRMIRATRLLSAYQHQCIALHFSCILLALYLDRNLAIMMIQMMIRATRLPSTYQHQSSALHYLHFACTLLALDSCFACNFFLQHTVHTYDHTDVLTQSNVVMS